jgi:hypothetical protein
MLRVTSVSSARSYPYGQTIRCIAEYDEEYRYYKCDDDCRRSNSDTYVVKVVAGETVILTGISSGFNIYNNDKFSLSQVIHNLRVSPTRLPRYVA